MRNLNRIILYSMLVVVVMIVINHLLTMGSIRRIVDMNSESGKKYEKHPVPASVIYTLYENGTGVFVDIRKAEKYTSSHIPGARSIPFRKFLRKPMQLNIENRSTPIIIYGTSQKQQEPIMIAGLLTNYEFINIFVLEDGFDSWTEGNYPIEVD